MVSEGDADQRLGRQERLRHNSDFQRVYREGRSFPGSLIVLFVLSAPGLVRRAGFVAGRRVGPAVERNRARRLMREAYRRHKGLVPAEGTHVVFVARRGSGSATFPDVERGLIGLLERVAWTNPVPPAGDS